MGRCVIFGAAAFDALILPIEKDDLVIAADGGLTHLSKIGISPDVMLAVRHGLQAGFRDFLIYGGMDGKRPDHTMANFQTLAFLRRNNAHGYLIGLEQSATVISGESAVFSSGATGTLSVFCLGDDASGVSIRGLKYSLENGTLSADFPLGVSNHFTGAEAEIIVKDGSLLLLWDTQTGLPSIR